MSDLGGKRTLGFDHSNNDGERVRMRFDAGPSVTTFFLAVAAGSVGGVILALLYASWNEPPAHSELWPLPAIVVAYGAFAAPFVLVGLAVFGLPATALLRPYWDKWWVGVVAALWGAIAGKIVWFAIDHLMFLGHADAFPVVDAGVLFGVPTAVAWWFLRRKEISKLP